MILPIFLPNAGCKHKCIFCDQFTMTGEKMPDLKKIEALLKSNNNVSEVAFYGGTFTGLPFRLQEKFFQTVKDFFPDALLRISTRPDEISEEIVRILKNYKVNVVELGIQSMYDDVLSASGRGHTVEDNIRAIKQLLESNIQVSAHLMIGLPEDSFYKSYMSMLLLIKNGVKIFRIHPTLVFKNTELEKMFIDGNYEPLSLEEALYTTSEMFLLSVSEKVKIIRLGYYVPESQKKSIIAGPYHPSFGDMVKADAIKKIITRLNIKNVFFEKRYESWFNSYGNKQLPLKSRKIISRGIFFENLSFEEAAKLALEKGVEKI
ncbi:radical SAM protein [Thermosipho ferrireducens]|uniref:Radical SAM protein n=1 Tax=Thermosipho ferrireducens TaxID=2571116 RepID=A0ABX7S9Z0_9BACT|nr:radical SAM protein [Thermosipho ferrireducens]QTA38221.1 radical SAM protein [Thermosipho ferrireducens]